MDDNNNIKCIEYKNTKGCLLQAAGMDGIVEQVRLQD